MKLTAIVSPPPTLLSISTQVSERRFHHVDEFMKTLSLIEGVTVSVVENSFAGAPNDGFLLVFPDPSEELENYPDFGPRTVLVSADSSGMRDDVEKYNLAGAITDDRYFRWRAERHREKGVGLFGRKDVAERIGATVLQSYSLTEHYGTLSHTQSRDLPELLVNYLTALEQ